MEKKEKPFRKWQNNLLDYILVNAEIFDELKVTEGINPSYRLIKVKHWDKK